MANRLAPPSEFNQQALADVTKALDSQNVQPKFSAEIAANISVAAGEFRFLAPRATGQNVTIPTADGTNFGKQITLFVSGALGTCRVRPASGTINGATSITLSAGYTTVLELVSAGNGKWATAKAAGFPTAGNALAYSGETLSYIGSTATVNVASASGDLNVVDISALGCGAVYTIQGVTEAFIDGFTAKPDGFWFILHVRDSTTSDFVSLLENSGNTTTSIRTPNARGWRLTKNDAVMMIYSNNRWRTVAGRDKIYLTPVNSVTWAAQQDNYQRINVETSTVEGHGVSGIRVTLTGNQTLTGVVPESIESNGELLHIDNIDSVDTLTIAHDVTSTAANRFFLPDSINLKLGPRTGALFRYDGTSSRWRLLGISPHGRLLTRTILTTGTGATFTHNPEARYFRVIGVGGGGAGGGTSGGGVTAGSLGSGGGSGSWGEKTYTIAATTSTYTVGAKGTGVSGAAGNNGTASTWTHNAVTLTLPAGSGGTVLAGAATAVFQSGGLGGGTPTNADAGGTGERGDYGFRLTAATTPACGGKGGSTPFGQGGSPGVTNGGLANGGAGGGYGSGGGGQVNGTGNTNTAGAAGADGIWIVEEWS